MTLPLIVTLQDGNLFANNPVVGISAYGSELRDTLYRLRVQNLEVITSVRQDTGASLAVMDEGEVSGSGTSGAFFPTLCAWGMVTTLNVAGRRVRQTRANVPHQHGNPLMVLLEGRFGVADPGTTGRIGMFDDQDGLFWQLNDDLAVGFNNNAVSTVIPRASWSGDPIDGTGASGFTYNPNAFQLFFIEFDPNNYIRFGLFINGIPIICHEISVANVTAVPLYCDTMLPLRFEIENDGTGIANFIACSSLVALGEHSNSDGITRSINRGLANDFTTAAVDTLYPILTLRIKPGIRSSYITPIGINVIAFTDVYFFYALFINPTFTGSETPTYTALPTSGIEYTTGYTNLTTITTDTSEALLSGYASSDMDMDSIFLNTEEPIGHDVFEVSDLLVLAVATVRGAAVEAYTGAITVRELL